MMEEEAINDLINLGWRVLWRKGEKGDKDIPDGILATFLKEEAGDIAFMCTVHSDKHDDICHYDMDCRIICEGVLYVVSGCDNIYDSNELTELINILIGMLRLLRKPIKKEEIPDDAIIFSPVLGFAVTSYKSANKNKNSYMSLKDITVMSNDLGDIKNFFTELGEDEVLKTAIPVNNTTKVCVIEPLHINKMTEKLDFENGEETYDLGYNYGNTNLDKDMDYWKEKAAGHLNELLYSKLSIDAEGVLRVLRTTR